MGICIVIYMNDEFRDCPEFSDFKAYSYIADHTQIGFLKTCKKEIRYFLYELFQIIMKSANFGQIRLEAFWIYI